MRDSFPKTEQYLSADRGGLSGLLLLTGLVVLGAWTAWAFAARITRFEISDSARLEVAGAATPIQSTLPGQVTHSYLSLGQEISAGDVLVELDARDQKLALAQEQARRSQFEPQLSALRMQVQAEDAGRAGEQEVLRYSDAAADAEQRRAQSAADLAFIDAQRAARLRAEGLISEADAQKSKALADSARASAESLTQTKLRLSPELRVRDSDRLLKQREILSQIRNLEAEAASSRVTMERLRLEIERRKVRAPVTGLLTECVTLHPGAHIAEGQQLGVILPSGRVKMIAAFSPAAALGKLHRGQTATIRLNAYPWAQFGVLNATVSKVAGEIRDSEVRVELDISPNFKSRIPLQHALPGTVEVEVEKITPAAMLLRSAGQAIGTH